MPKENTHLWFAQAVADRLEDEAERRLVLDNLDAYRLGSISPDMFFYAKGGRLTQVSDYLHAGGDGPNWEFVRDCLDCQDRGGATDSGPDLAFVLGYLTHCGLDVTFHPVVNAIARDMNGPQLPNHYRVETALDREFNREFFLDQIAGAGFIQQVRRLRPVALLAERFGTNLDDIEAVLRRMRFANRAFRRSSWWLAAKLLCRLGASRICALAPLFYASLREGWPGGRPVTFECIHYHDLDTGEERMTSAGELFGRAHELAGELLAEAWERYRTARDECRPSLAGVEADSPGRLEARPEDSTRPA